MRKTDDSLETGGKLPVMARTDQDGFCPEFLSFKLFILATIEIELQHRRDKQGEITMSLQRKFRYK